MGSEVLPSSTDDLNQLHGSHLRPTMGHSGAYIEGREGGMCGGGGVWVWVEGEKGGVCGCVCVGGSKAT